MRSILWDICHLATVTSPTTTLMMVCPTARVARRALCRAMKQRPWFFLCVSLFLCPFFFCFCVTNPLMAFAFLHKEIVSTRKKMLEDALFVFFRKYAHYPICSSVLIYFFLSYLFLFFIFSMFMWFWISSIIQQTVKSLKREFSKVCKDADIKTEVLDSFTPFHLCSHFQFLVSFSLP